MYRVMNCRNSCGACVKHVAHAHKGREADVMQVGIVGGEAGKRCHACCTLLLHQADGVCQKRHRLQATDWPAANTAYGTSKYIPPPHTHTHTWPCSCTELPVPVISNIMQTVVSASSPHSFHWLQPPRPTCTHIRCGEGDGEGNAAARLKQGLARHCLLSATCLRSQAADLQQQQQQHNAAPLCLQLLATSSHCAPHGQVGR